MTEIRGNFLEDVAQRRWRPNRRRYRERESMRLRRAAIFTVIRILAEDHDLDVVGAGEAQCAEYVGGIDGFARRALSVDETAKRRVGITVDERTQMCAPGGRQCVELGFERDGVCGLGRR